MVGRDSERTAVYAAEGAAFEGTDLETRVPFDELARRGSFVTSDRWWPGPAIEIRRARRDSGTSSTRCEPSGAVVRIAADQSTLATLAHELAHALAGSEHGHDGVFRAAYLDVVEVVTNVVPTDRRRGLHVGQLAASFAATGLTVADRHWPRPGHGDPIAL